ncbi:MAG: HD domain-containing protein [Legionellales bacterium]
MLMSTIETTINTISRYFVTAGTTNYIGESVSQVEHALQCAYFAEQSGHSEEVILASLLHDIGHFATTTKQHTMADLGIVHHEWIGALLAYQLNFSAKVALLIGHHVNAKRYLAGKKPHYFARLSSASQQTLAYQGGAMASNERLAFEQLPFFREILQVRVNDEKAKEINLLVPDLEHFNLKIQQHIKGQQIRTSLNEACLLTDFVTAQWVEQFKTQLEFESQLHCV